MKNTNCITWKKASESVPQHEYQKWSRDVICLTNYGNVYKLAFCGVWQRLLRFEPEECVEWWIENPQYES